MKRTLLCSFIIAAFCTSAYAKAAPKNTQRVLPEISTEVSLSNSDVNRVVCESGEAVKPVYSKEKPMDVKIGSDRRTFWVKFKYLVKPNGENHYLSEPVELFLTCGTSTYELIVKPEFGPPHKLLLGSDNKNKIKSNQAMFGALSLEEAALMLTTKMITDGDDNGLPESFEVRPAKGGWTQDIYDMRGRKVPVEVKPEREVMVEGTGLRGMQYTVRALSSVQLDERMFTNTRFGENIFAVTAERLALSAGQVSSLVIIQREAM